MKKLAYVFLAAVLFTACSEDPIVDDQNQLDTTPLVEADLSKMIPAAEFDASVNGMYAGIITTQDRSFHGKIWINVGNDGNYMAETRSKKEKVSFKLIEREGDVLTFSGDRGSFIFNISDLSNPKIEEATFDGGHADIVVSKEIGGAKFGIILGVYTEIDFVSTRGTWDFIINTATGADYIDQVVIQKPLPYSGVKVESAAAGDFELGASCYGEDFPFFISSSLPAAPGDEEIELMMTGQVTPYPGVGTTVLYDLAFSKFICDANGLDYNRMVGFPTSTTAIFFDPPLDPVDGTCRNITFGGPVGHGMYAELADSDGSVVSAGLIRIDTSTFVPFVPTAGLTSDDDTPQLLEATASLKK